eukprot:TRINITY_DN121_c0_g1_i2.p1 TRINITY_DN121_c0_g1~~TRINITY_DN121_c0_g1_i2.p1  ORF type:complete len:184 (+),score=38.64 TRINITY_DN121_c0_g1_i2:205-756(+)
MEFIQKTKEDPKHNQYWYSSHTIQTLVDEIVNAVSHIDNPSVACLSTPSIYFSLPTQLRDNSYLFDFDTQWSSDRGFVHYDFHHPEDIPSHLLHRFDYVIVDPPFITADVWKMYIEAVNMLLKEDGKILVSTIFENRSLLHDYLKLEPRKWLPSIPKLVYQYRVFTNYHSPTLDVSNPEVPDD